MFTVKSLSKVLVPALALGALVIGGTANAQTYTFNTSSAFTSGVVNGATATAASPITVTQGQNVTLTGTGAAAGAPSFSYTPDFSPSPLVGVPFDNIVPFTIRANAGTGTATFNDLFNLTVNIMSNGASQAFTFNNIGFNGTLSNTTDTVQFTGIPTGVQSAVIGGNLFTVQLNTFTNPGNATGANPVGTIGGRVTNVTLATVPEPGTVAMFAGMATTGLGLLARRRRK